MDAKKKYVLQNFSGYCIKVKGEGRLLRCSTAQVWKGPFKEPAR